MLKLENSIRGLSFSRVAFDLTIQDIENPRIVRGFSKSFSVASSKSYSFRVRLDCGPSTAIKTLKEAI